MDEVVAIRAHRPDRRTLRVHTMFARQFGAERVFVIADEVTSPPQSWPADIQVVRITRDKLHQLGLRDDLRDSGWRCGDYAQAVLFDAVEADRVWMFENDVAFSRLSAREFVSFYDNVAADYISFGVIPLRSSGFWSGTLSSRGFTGEEWHCFYPVTRVSRAASDASLALRQRVQHVPSALMQPNDETVMASAVVEAGLSVYRLEDALPFP
ncbi:hypothetical protein ACWKWA_06105 [Dermacoccus abyssi]